MKNKILILASIIIFFLILIITIFIRITKNSKTNNGLITSAQNINITPVSLNEQIKTSVDIEPIYQKISRISIPNGATLISPSVNPLTIDIGFDDWTLGDIVFTIQPEVQFSLMKKSQYLEVTFKERLLEGHKYTYQIRSKKNPLDYSATYSFTTDGELKSNQEDMGLYENLDEVEKEKRERPDVYISNILHEAPSKFITRFDYVEDDNGKGKYKIIVSGEDDINILRKDFEDWLKTKGLSDQEIKKVVIEYYLKGEEPPIKTDKGNKPSSITPTRKVNRDSARLTEIESLLSLLNQLSLDEHILPNNVGTNNYAGNESLSITPYLVKSDDGNIQKVINLAQTIISNCNAPDDKGVYMQGRVRRSNHLCLNSVSDVGTQASLRVFLTNGFEYLQCINFVHASNRILYGSYLDNGRSSNNAVDFSIYVPKGYEFINKKNPIKPLSPGDIAIWDYYVSLSGGRQINVGHIAYVTKVYNQETLNFEVADANSKGHGVVAIQNKYDKPSFKGWLVKL